MANKDKARQSGHKVMIAIKLWPDFLDEIDAAAKRRHISRTTFIEKALARVIAADQIRDKQSANEAAAFFNPKRSKQ